MTISVEQVVKKSWCEVLKIQDAELDDNFFMSGGHSFAAVELMRKVESDLPIKFPFEAFLTDGSLQALIDECERLLNTTVGTDTPE